MFSAIQTAPRCAHSISDLVSPGGGSWLLLTAINEMAYIRNCTGHLLSKVRHAKARVIATGGGAYLVMYPNGLSQQIYPTEATLESAMEFEQQNLSCALVHSPRSQATKQTNRETVRRKFLFAFSPISDLWLHSDP
jgi:hypothetical protein